jgi:hypothetical protein
VGGSEGVDGDVSGEEAAWRDLVARFDLPVETEADQLPWPARENLTQTARDRQRPERDTADAESGWDPGAWEQPRAPRPPSRPGPSSLPGPARLPGHPGYDGWRTDPADGDQEEAGPGDAAPGGPPAANSTDTDPDAPAAGGRHGRPPATDTGTDTGAGAGTNETAEPGPAGATPRPSGAGRHGRPPAGRFPGDRMRIIRPAGSVPSPAAAGDDEDEDDRYRPPPPAPLPKLDSMGKAAWAGLLGGPGYLLAATLLGWQVSDWSALLAIVAFVAGFAILVLRLGDKPRDDDDNGAVV